MKSRVWILICAIPILSALFVWFSALSFVPVPWPDDSAFYFVAKHLFAWPPRWVMLPQAPFEPTYRIFNFNTMPLYPLAIGLGRFIGIDGSFALKFWPLAGWAASGVVLVRTLQKKGLPLLVTALIALAIAGDPVLRWASVLIRPESWIGFCGMLIVLKLTFEDTDQKYPWYWNPIAALLATGAYLHFNSIHLVLPIVLGLINRPRKIVEIGLKTLLYLTPYFVAVIWHFKLFVYQMQTQWSRLAVGNDWLSSPEKYVNGLMQSMGSPSNWPEPMLWATVILAILIVFAVLNAVPFKKKYPSLTPAAAWVLSACLLWENKPEVWFTYYIHLAFWCFAGVTALNLYKEIPRAAWVAALAPVLAITTLFWWANISQAIDLGETQSWHWNTYYDLVDCVDKRLTQYEHDIGDPKPFRVWFPTIPDLTVEMSRRHPDWDLTRTNDFWNRQDLAIQHGKDIEAVVVPETINLAERNVEGPAAEHPEIQSVWMNWNGYFLIRLTREPGWKPNRYVCQRGRWQAFIYMR